MKLLLSLKRYTSCAIEYRAQVIRSILTVSSLLMIFLRIFVLIGIEFGFGDFAK